MDCPGIEIRSPSSLSYLVFSQKQGTRFHSRSKKSLKTKKQKSTLVNPKCDSFVISTHKYCLDWVTPLVRTTHVITSVGCAIYKPQRNAWNIWQIRTVSKATYTAGSSLEKRTQTHSKFEKPYNSSYNICHKLLHVKVCAGNYLLQASDMHDFEMTETPRRNILEFLRHF